MSLSNNMETASWLKTPAVSVWESIKLLFTRRVFELLESKTLFDGALVSHTGEPIITIHNFLNPARAKLNLISWKKHRLTSFNPGVTRIFCDPEPIQRGNDLAAIRETGFQVMNHIESENAGLTREVDYPEAFRYIGFPDLSLLIRNQNISREVRQILSGPVHQVTREGSERIRLVERKISQGNSGGFFGGGGSLRNRKPLHV